MKTHVSLISEVVDFHDCHESYGSAADWDRDSDGNLHVHPFYQLDLFPDGGVTVHTEGGKSFPAACWSGILLPPMTGHGYSSDHTALQITFKFHVHPRYWLMFGRPSRMVVFPPSCVGLIDDLRHASPRDSFLSEQQLAAAIAICVTHWLRQTDSPRAAETDDAWGYRIRSALERIAETPEAPWSVADLARQCGTSADHFCRQFRRIVGISPQRFILEFRMRTAASYLLSDNIAIKGAADRIGYSSVHAFSRAFRNAFGTSPAAYLNAVSRHR